MSFRTKENMRKSFDKFYVMDELRKCRGGLVVGPMASNFGSRFWHSYRKLHLKFTNSSTVKENIAGNLHKPSNQFKSVCVVANSHWGCVANTS